ncbi:hypothetical protein J6590_041937 [Homalodisca vitripennis]|nr:hypothetical protein J6590_041937 [Homalodisca vitripennis]
MLVQSLRRNVNLFHHLGGHYFFHGKRGSHRLRPNRPVVRRTCSRNNYFLMRYNATTQYRQTDRPAEEREITVHCKSNI